MLSFFYRAKKEVLCALEFLMAFTPSLGSAALVTTLALVVPSLTWYTFLFSNPHSILAYL